MELKYYTHLRFSETRVKDGLPFDFENVDKPIVISRVTTI